MWESIIIIIFRWWTKREEEIEGSGFVRWCEELDLGSWEKLAKFVSSRFGIFIKRFSLLCKDKGRVKSVEEKIVTGWWSQLIPYTCLYLNPQARPKAHISWNHVANERRMNVFEILACLSTHHTASFKEVLGAWDFEGVWDANFLASYLLIRRQEGMGLHLVQ